MCNSPCFSLKALCSLKHYGDETISPRLCSRTQFVSRNVSRNVSGVQCPPMSPFSPFPLAYVSSAIMKQNNRLAHGGGAIGGGPEPTQVSNGSLPAQADPRQTFERTDFEKLLKGLVVVVSLTLVSSGSLRPPRVPLRHLSLYPNQHNAYNGSPSSTQVTPGHTPTTFGQPTPSPSHSKAPTAAFRPHPATHVAESSRKPPTAFLGLPRGMGVTRGVGGCHSPQNGHNVPSWHGFFVEITK